MTPASPQRSLRSTDLLLLPSATSHLTFLGRRSMSSAFHKEPSNPRTSLETSPNAPILKLSARQSEHSPDEFRADPTIDCGYVLILSS